jgi:hypothetical protein
MTSSRSPSFGAGLEPVPFQLFDLQRVGNRPVPGLSDGIRKKEKPFDFSLVVDYTGKISNLLEDLEKMDRFAQSVDDELMMRAKYL